MSRDPQRLPDYLGHILEAIERIRKTIHSDLPNLHRLVGSLLRGLA